MKTKHEWILSTLLALSLIALPTAVVLAKSINFLTIRGPGIKGEIMLNEPGAMQNLLETGFLFGEYSLAPTPNDPGDGYRVIAYLYLDGPTVPFVDLIYYPPSEGQSGLVHYTARLNGDEMKLEPVEDWRKVPLSVSKQVYAVFASQGVILQPIALSNPAQAKNAQTGIDVEKGPLSAQSPSIVWLWAVVWIPLAAFTGFILRRLNNSQHPSTGD